MAKKKESKIDFRHNLKVYWNLLRKRKSLLILLLFFVFIVEATYIADRFMLKLLIDNGTLFSQGDLARNLFVKILLIALAIYASLVILRTATKWFEIHFLAHLDSDLMKDLKCKFFNHIVHLSYDFHITNKKGSLISRLIRGGSAIESLTDTILFNFSPLIFQFILVIASIVYFDLTSAIIVAIFAIAFISYSILINKIQQSSRLEALKAEDTEKAIISDIFTNIESVKYFGKETRVKGFFAKLAQNTRNALVKSWFYYRWLDSGQLLLIGLATVLLLYFPITKFLNGQITMGTLVFIYTVFGNLMGPLFSFVWGVRAFYRSVSDCQDLFRYEKIQNEIKDKPNAPELKIKSGEIEFRNVTFKYKSKNLFENFNLKIPANKKVALVGPSGSGKTTLIRLLYRLYDLQAGEILIDGKNINSFKQESLRGELSIVPQECVLFDETIYNNIAFSKTGARKDEVMRAMKSAQLDSVIARLPKKHNTIVGERGVKLSGGEKQRVSIARAILDNKKVLVLDEATSALDSKTEHNIHRDLEKLMKGRTSIIIAHRLSTIMGADIIVVLDRGKIVQIGNHNQLLKESGMYGKLWSMQKGGYIR